MLTTLELELFRLVSTSFVVRGKWRWTCEELSARLVAHGLDSECAGALESLCREGWMATSSSGKFDITESGKSHARDLVGPFTAGGL